MLKNPFENREVWFLTGSQDLYGPEALAQVEDQSKQLVEVLNSSGDLPLKVVWQPVCKERTGIWKLIQKANSDPNCVGLVAWMHTFSPAKSWISALRDLQLPLLHLHTQFDQHLPWQTIDMDYMNLNQSAHGDREFGYMLTRMGIPRKTVVGHVKNKDVRRRIAAWMRASVGLHELKQMKIARIGDNMRNVAVTEGDKVQAEIDLGVSVNTWPVNEYAELVASVTDQEVDDLVAEYEETYDVVPELKTGGERHESLREGARQEIALERFLEERNASGFTDTFEDLGALKQLPGLAVQRMMSKGYGFGAEGDWKTAVLVRLAKVMGYGLDGGASLMEDYCYEFEPGEELILGAHMLEICPSLTAQKPTLEIHELGIGDREDPVRLKFNADRGPAVVVSMIDMKDRFRLVGNVVNVVGPNEELKNLPVASAVWVPEPSFSVATECWLNAGGAHHTVLSSQINAEIWEDFARMARLELALIDANTDVNKFTNELRLNDLFYTLNQK